MLWIQGLANTIGMRIISVIVYKNNQKSVIIHFFDDSAWVKDIVYLL